MEDAGEEEGKEARSARGDASSSLRTGGYGLEERFLFCKAYVVSLYDDQKPHIDALIVRIMRWKTEARLLAERAWPPLRRILIIIGGVALTIFFAWLNCFIKGLKSLVQLQIAALFMVICCMVLNLGFLGGFLKLLAALVSLLYLVKTAV